MIQVPPEVVVRGFGVTAVLNLDGMFVAEDEGLPFVVVVVVVGAVMELFSELGAKGEALKSRQ